MQKKILYLLLSIFGLVAFCFFPSCASKKSEVTNNTNNNGSDTTPPVPSEYGQRRTKEVYEEYQSPQPIATSLTKDNSIDSALPFGKPVRRLGWGAKRARNIMNGKGAWSRNLNKNAEGAFLKQANSPTSGFTRTYEYNSSDHMYYRRFSGTYLSGATASAVRTLNSRGFPTYSVVTFSNGTIRTYEMTFDEKFYKLTRWTESYEDTDTPRYKQYEETRTRDSDGWVKSFTEKEFRADGSVEYDSQGRVLIRGPYYFFCPERYYEYYENGQPSIEISNSFDDNTNVPSVVLIKNTRRTVTCEMNGP